MTIKNKQLHDKHERFTIGKTIFSVEMVKSFMALKIEGQGLERE